MRDNSLAKQLIVQGHEVTMLPTYLPHFLDEEAATGDEPIFFGGINVYLQHKFSIFRKTPSWVDKALDNKWLLRKAAARSGMTSSQDLGEITISTFRGENGPLAKEVKKVVQWFKTHGVPDIILLSTIMLAGIGKVLKRELKVPVLGFLQGEDSFLDSLLPKYRLEAWRLLSADAKQLDGCIAPSTYFGNLMADRLNIHARDVLHHPNGITLEGFEPPGKPTSVPTVGYLARLCPLKGLDLLVDSFIELKELDKFSNLRLEVAGGMTADDEPYVEEQERKLVQAGFENCFSIRPNLTRAQKLDFLKRLTVLSVPARYPEAFGLYVIEAMAAGVPVVLPDAGAFPEIINTTQGGRLYDAGQLGAFTDTLDELLSDRAEAHKIGTHAHCLVTQKYANEVLAQSLVENILTPFTSIRALKT